MTAKTALPIARLRSLGCKVSTIIGHDVPSPITGRSPRIRAVWKYGITLPNNLGRTWPLDASDVEATYRRASASWHQPTRRIMVTGLSPAPTHDNDEVTAKADRLSTEADVAGLLNRIADTISKA